MARDPAESDSSSTVLRPDGRAELSQRGASRLSAQPDWLRSFLRCPECGSRVEDPWRAASLADPVLVCMGCSRRFGLSNGVIDFLSTPSDEASEEIEGNRKMVRQERAECDDDWLLGLPRTHQRQRPAMAYHDEEADLAGLMQAAGSPPLRVLDLGAGTCWTASRWAVAGHQVVASDISLEKFIGLHSAATFIASTGVPFDLVRFDMNVTWPFANATFDVVAAMSSIHHAASLRAIHREASRVLRPSGKMLIIDTTRSIFVPESRADFGVREREEFHRHERIYAQNDYRAAAADAGMHLTLMAAPSFVKKLDLLAVQGIVTGQTWKHRLGRAGRAILRARSLRRFVAGPAFGAINLVVGTQFLGVAEPCIPQHDAQRAGTSGTRRDENGERHVKDHRHRD